MRGIIVLLGGGDNLGAEIEASKAFLPFKQAALLGDEFLGVFGPGLEFGGLVASVVGGHHISPLRVFRKR